MDGSNGTTDPSEDNVSAFEAQRARQHRQWTMLVEKLYQQMRYGCIDDACKKPLCQNYQIRVNQQKGRPYRRPTRSTATALATALSTDPDAKDRLCQRPLKPVIDGDGAFVGTPAGTAIDDKSLIQQLYNTQAWKSAGATIHRDRSKVKKLCTAIQALHDQAGLCFEDVVAVMESVLLQDSANTWTSSDTEACFEYMHSRLEAISDTSEATGWNIFTAAAALLIVCLEPHPHEFPEANWTQWVTFSCAVENGPLACTGTPKNSATFYKYLSCALSRPGINVAERFFSLLYQNRSYKRFFDHVFPATEALLETPDPKTLSPQYRDSLMEVLCVWAKLVFRNRWQSVVVIPESSHEHHALRFLHELIVYNEHNVWPFYKESYGRMPLVGNQIDIVKEPPIWHSRKDDDAGVHLFQYKFLFSRRERVVFYRSINFHRMLHAFEKAMEVNMLMTRMYVTYRESSSSLSRRDDIMSRLRTTATQCLVLQVNRDHILEDVLNQLWRRERRELLRPLKVKFGTDVGEEGVDLGGLQQEFFRLAFAQALDPKLGLFTVDQSTQIAWFKPLSPTPLYQFALVGMLFGLAMYNGITLPVNLPRYFYRWLKGEQDPEFGDLEDGWPDVYSSLKALKNYEGDDLEDVFSIDKTFTIDVIGRRVELDMNLPFPSDLHEALDQSDEGSGANDAVPVTRVNRDEYLKMYTDWLLHRSVKPQLDAFEKGFRTFFSSKDLDILTPDDFHKMVEGERTIDVQQLKRVARYEDGYHPENQTIVNFWKVVENFDQAQLRSLLEFVTATDRMPVAGMQDLVFVIMKSGDGGSDGRRLPSSHTCFNRLMLPDYPNRELLEDRLQVAIRNSEGFGMP